MSSGWPRAFLSSWEGSARLFAQSTKVFRLRRGEGDARPSAEFFATLSHRLRTPLTAIVGWAHLLKGGKLSVDDTSRAIDTIIRNASTQARIIEELLDGPPPDLELHSDAPVHSPEPPKVVASLAASRNAGKAGRM